jgi:hypothetical protein
MCDQGCIVCMYCLLFATKVGTAQVAASHSQMRVQQAYRLCLLAQLLFANAHTMRGPLPLAVTQTNIEL